ncbi:MAG: hypothetical protein A7316_04395 [Candidatus Altiarchaeales archaeon WOR_SM1_86-2]|nr:MAG: hypothetical protein A7316_04395 [Candidatus Altiarchaeales archaeon WOR_SM1_86-2]ODS39893.1 MAG: hypothetical protein A7315_10230 [Candidatus Altiarchaeales archaeon WOR_SM1_79]
MYKSIHLPEKIEKDIKEYMSYERTEEEVALEQLLEMGVSEWKRERAINLLRDGKITLQKSADFAGISLWEMIEIVKERKIDWLKLSGKDIEEDFKSALEIEK